MRLLTMNVQSTLLSEGEGLYAIARSMVMFQMSDADIRFMSTISLAPYVKLK